MRSDEPLVGRPFSNFHMYEANGSKLVFRNCDFSYSVIERCYFRSARFEGCNFTGAKILDSNFRSVEFAGCIFDYVTIQRSHVPTQELLRNLPAYANVRRDFLQQLRANASSIGDATHTNVLVAKELQAERDYWREARLGTSTYYQQKYAGPRKQLEAYRHSIGLWLDQSVWGHGESIIRLITSTFACLCLLTLFRWFTYPIKSVEAMNLGQLLDAMLDTWCLYLDLPFGLAGDKQYVWSSVVVLLRYLTLGLFIAVLFRKLSKR